MTSNKIPAASKKPFVCATLAAASFMLAASLAHAQAVYPTPEAAAQALTDAIASSDEAALSKVLGKDHARYVPTSNVGEDDIYAYLGSWAKEHRIVEDAEPLGGRKSAHVETGGSGWTLPIPLVDTGKGWRFDMPAAKNEVLTRRIGRNERSVMNVALAYVDAQNDYRKLMNRYADRFVSTPGKHDGLYWDTAPGEPESPLGPLAATMPKKTHPSDAYYGYHYRILNAQDLNAKGGAPSDGFSMIAWPANYGETGVMTFIVNQDGRIYEKNLGPASTRVAASIKAFDPDSSWQPVSP